MLGLLAAATVVLCAQRTFAVNPTVKLNYTTYQGTALSNGITQWLGVRYAAPPVGDLRFSPPQDPLVNNTVQIADTHGPICLATGASPRDTSTSEDCLYLDVYAPSNATNAPVFFFIQGGGFNSNSNSNYNGTGLIQASDHNIIVINFNYRVGPYGFLASQEVVNDPTASTNNGLKDQIKALEWIQRYVSQFGGDPNHVTIGGDSAGAASVSLLLSAYGGKDLGLFHGAAAESCSFAAVLNVNQSQFMYNNLAIRTGCAGKNNTLACLRSLSAYDLQTYNFNTPFPGAQQPPLYMYGPTNDGDFIREVTYTAFANGHFQKIPIIMGADMNDGASFAPRQTYNYSQAYTFMSDQFPALTLDQLEQIQELYPVNGTEQDFPNSGPYYRVTSDMYGQMRYMCPGLFINAMYRKHSVPQSWAYLWNVTDPDQIAQGLGVPHTIEVNAIWGPPNVRGGAPASYYPGGLNANIVPVVQAYWTSFIRSYNPNTYRLKGQPQWKQYKVGEGAGGQQRLVFATNNTRNAMVSGQQRTRCEYFWGIGASVNQ